MMLSRARRLLAGGLLLAALVTLLNGCQSSSCRAPGVGRCPPAIIPPASVKQAEAPCPKVSEAMACVTVRPRGQLGLKLDGTDTPLLERWGVRVGVPLENVDCFAVVLLDDQGRRALLVRTKRPIRRKAVRRACEARAPAPRGPGKCTITTTANGLVVSFPEPRLAVIADSLATMNACLAERAALRAHLNRGGKHDLTVWARATPVSEGQEVVTSYKAAGPLMLPKEKKPRSGLFGQPLPFAVKTATLSVDVGEAIALRGKVVCEDEEGARQGARLLNSVLDFGRGMLLAGAGNFDLVLALGGDAEIAKLPERVPLDLIRPVEKALQQATAKAEGKTVVLRARLPISGRRAGVELLKFEALSGAALSSFEGPGLFFDQATARAASPDEGAAAVVPCLTPPSHPIGVVPLPADEGAAAVVPCLTPPGPAEQSLPIPSGPPTAAVPSTSPLPPLPPPPEAGRFQLSVANCRKEPVLLFRVETTGALTLLEKVEAGDVVDVPVQAGERLAAVFMNAPHQVQHVATPAQPTWLLRLESVKPPVVPVSTYKLQVR